MGTYSGEDADLYQHMMVRWNEWQLSTLNHPAIRRDFPLEQVLSFRMSHRLGGLESVYWFLNHIKEEGLSSLQDRRWHQACDGPIQLRVFSVSESELAILNGHHRLVAACLAAHELPGISWDDSLSFLVHGPPQETVELWRLSIAEMDPFRCSRNEEIIGAQDTLGTLREYLGDFSDFESREGSI